MKAITLWQPWASFMVAVPDPPKTIETRSWPTSYRGWLLIHAAKRPVYLHEWERPSRAELVGHLRENYSGQFHFDDVLRGLPRGAILGAVFLTDCEPTPVSHVIVAPEEYMLGDFTRGRFAWRTHHPAKFTDPVPCTGHQRIWNVPNDVVALLPQSFLEVAQR